MGSIRGKLKEEKKESKEPLAISVTTPDNDSSDVAGATLGASTLGLSLGAPTTDCPRSIRGKLKSAPKETASTNSTPRSGVKVVVGSSNSDAECDGLRKELAKAKSTILQLEAKVGEFKKLQNKYERLKREYWKLKDSRK